MYIYKKCEEELLLHFQHVKGRVIILVIYMSKSCQAATKMHLNSCLCIEKTYCG